METPFHSTIEQLTGMAVFVRVVEAKSFTAAGRQLGLTKSAVSKQVAKLQAQLATRLLQRTTRNVSLTEAGRVLYGKAAQAMTIAQDARGELMQLSEVPRGALRVASTVALGRSIVVPHLPDFLARFPEVRLQLSLINRAVDLAEEGYDLAICPSVKLPDAVIASKLMKIRYAVCAAPDYIARHGTPERPEALADHNCLYYGHVQAGDSWAFSAPAGETSVRVSGNFVANNSEAIRELVLGGAGIGLLPNYAVASDLACGRLLELLEEWEPKGPFGEGVYAVWLPNRYLPPKVRVFVDFLRERLATI